MLYDKIVNALIDLKRAIKEKLGDDGNNKRGSHNYTSGPLGLDRIQYEISRIAAAMRHTTGGGGGSADAVKFIDMVEPDTLYTNSKEEQKRPRDYSIINKFKTLGEMVGDPRWGDEATVKFTLGSDFSNESLSLESVKNITLFSEAAPDVVSVKMGSLSLTGTTDDISLIGLSLCGTTTYGSKGVSVVAQNCNFLGPINAVPSGLETEEELVRSFEKCRHEGDAIFNGSAVVEYGFYDCWAYPKEDGSYPTITLNNPNGTLILSGKTDLKMHVNVIQGNLIVDCPGLIDIHTAGSGWVALIGGGCWQPGNPTVYNAITLNHTGKLIEGTFLFDRPTSNQGGAWASGGIGANNVRDNRIREGYTAVVVPLAGDPVRTNPNTVTDQLNGISAELVLIKQLLTGTDMDIIDSPDGTMIQFVKKSDHTQVLYQMAKPQAIQGSSSFSVEGGIGSVILTPGSPIYNLITTLLEAKADRPPDGMGYSSNDFTATLMGKLSAMADIRQVTQANGLHLIGNTLSMDPSEARSTVDLSASCNGTLLVFSGTYTHSAVAMVYLNGLKLSKGKNYSITETALTLTTTPPATGSVLEVELF